MSRLNFRGHIARRDYAINMVAPTASGSAISEQTLSGTTGTWASDESLITGYVYQWQTADAPDFAIWADLAGATSISLLLTASQISKKLRLGVAAINGDGQSPFVYTAPTAIIQDAPAIPLAIHGTPVTAASQGDTATFIVSFDGGSGTYTPSLINAPLGSSVTTLSSGDQAAVTLSTSSPGSYGGIIVRVSDGATTADLASFTFTVNSVGSIQTVIPGTGWTGLTTSVNGVDVTAQRGSSSNVGYNFSPTCYVEEPPFFEIDSPYILWIHAYHTGPLSDFDTNHPLFGMEKVTVACDGGAWLTLSAQYNSAENFWGFPVRIDPAQWADGYPSETVRCMRFVAWPRNGKPRVLQNAYNDARQAFKFTTNANGTFTRTKRYFGSNGSSGNDGLTPATPKVTMEQAIASFSPDTAHGRDYGDLELICTGGTNLAFSTSSTRATTFRAMKLSPLAGLQPSDCVFTGSNSSGMGTRLFHVKGVSFSGIQATGISGSSGYFEDCSFDGGATWLAQDFPFNHANVIAWVRGGVYNNYGSTFRGTRSVVNVTVPLCGRNFIQNVLYLRNVTLQTIPSTSNLHPDTFQYYNRNNINVLGAGWTYGGIAENVTVLNANAQGPFFKDNNYIIGMFMYNCNFSLNNTGRNTFVIGSNTTGPNGDGTQATYPYTILQNSMFWESSFLGGNANRGEGVCDNVIFKNTHMQGGNYPNSALVYEAAH